MPVNLDSELWFPDPRTSLNYGRYRGLVAVGGDLSVKRLLLAYRSGLFPWSVNPITWWSPDPRAIFELSHFHVSKSLAKTIRKGTFRVTINHAFKEVISACAAPGPSRSETWISPEFVKAYTELHDQGYAHSVECWAEGNLAGGVYGVSVGGLFAAESMFHRADDASKVALFHLVELLRTSGFGLMDIQMVTPHTASLGAIEISRDEYLDRLCSVIDLPCSLQAGVLSEAKA